MEDNRVNPTTNMKLLLYSQVDGRCPFCSKNLYYIKNNKIQKLFEIAHIYPANPKTHESELLKDVPRLSEDVNSMENLIVVCRDCHKKFDHPRTTEDYNRWYDLKKDLMLNDEAKSAFFDNNVEEEIIKVLNALVNIDCERELVQLSLSALKLDEKINKENSFIFRKKIREQVVDYYSMVREQFNELDVISPYQFEKIATQVKGYYLTLSTINENQESVFRMLVTWLDEKTGKISTLACEIIISFFIQNCEVFS
ncbi:HNH endonuclease [Listeria innocua]|uniref:ABC-three component system protein n=1 Tax=Listeria innocua TaxID=1642 RepID=UPI00162969DE|nr:ABC-three component system protein [Listeria innocua]MBC1416777.1 HNH endonuclease [Listeria innocua]